jgi:hypothetical protein
MAPRVLLGARSAPASSVSEWCVSGRLGRPAGRVPRAVEQVTGPTLERLAELAERLQRRVLAGIFEAVEGRPADAETSCHVTLRQASFPTKAAQRLGQPLGEVHAQDA